jgi:large subunit ribosomal protein L15
MRLHTLQNRPGARTRSKRLGHGESSGLGKTSGRGGKGQTARAGGTLRVGFEGGQMPLIRRVPKRGFNNARHRISYLGINVGSLESFAAGSVVDIKGLWDSGVARGPRQLVKILGTGDLTHALTVHAHAFSATAKAKIEAVGGQCQVIQRGAPSVKA